MGYRNPLKKSKNFIAKIFKIILIIFSSVLLVSIIVNISSSSKKPKSHKWIEGEYFEESFVEESIEPTNTDGTFNGLNLMLINNIQNECYTKEYLSLLSENQQSGFNPYQYHVNVQTAIALNLAEQGPYAGTPIPCSYLPWDSENNCVFWNKERAGYPAEALTLKKGNKYVYAGNSGQGLVDPYPAADQVAGGDTANGGTASPFQIGRFWIGFIKDNMPKYNGYNTDSNREPDITYFPDQITYIDRVLNTTVPNYLNLDSLTSEQQSSAACLFFADGEGNVCNTTLYGFGTATDETARTSRTEVFKKVCDSLDKISDETLARLMQFSVDTGETHQLLTVALCISVVEEGGWFIDASHAMEDSTVNSAYFIVHPDASSEDYENFKKKYTKTPSTTGSISGRNSSLHIFHEGDFNSFTENISMGHLLMTYRLGAFYYATMLKYAGVDIDPSNPSTYYSNLANGNVDEWLPPNYKDVLSSNGVDLTKLSEGRAKLLNEGLKLLGVKYVFGGYTPPNKNPDGSYDINTGCFDCSSFTNYIALTALGIDIGRTTYNQVNSPNVEYITLEQAKPGDLLIRWADAAHADAHVVVFLKNNGDGTITVLHAPQSNDVVKIGNYSCSTPGNNYQFVKIKGIDG